MNYQKIYNSFIESRQKLKRDKKSVIYENHHIVPKSVGGSDESSNLILLTLDEHAFAHKLLYKIHKNDKILGLKMLYALKMMTNMDKPYLFSRMWYKKIREKWLLNIPAKQENIKKLIKKTLKNNRLKNGYKKIVCACGCNTEIGVSKRQLSDIRKKYIKGHKPIKFCICGCGKKTKNRLRIKNHNKKIKCACGCNLNTHKVYDSRFPDRKVYAAGHDVAAKQKRKKSLSHYLSSLNNDEMKKRMKNSILACDQKSRAKAIKHGKASILEITHLNGTKERIYSYEVLEKLNITWQKLKYLILTHNGILSDGKVVKYIVKYQGGNRWKNMK